MLRSLSDYCLLACCCIKWTVIKMKFCIITIWTLLDLVNSDLTRFHCTRNISRSFQFIIQITLDGSFSNTFDRSAGSLRRGNVPPVGAIGKGSGQPKLTNISTSALVASIELSFSDASVAFGDSLAKCVEASEKAAFA